MRRRNSAQPAINITPLVDVVLVLLIIFMVVTPVMENSQSVTIPSIMFPDPETKGRMAPLELTIASDGTFLLGEDVLSLDQIEPRLGAVRAAEPSRSVVLRGDVGIPYGDARKVYQIIETLRFPGVALAVSENPNKKHPFQEPDEASER